MSEVARSTMHCAGKLPEGGAGVSDSPRSLSENIGRDLTRNLRGAQEGRPAPVGASHEGFTRVRRPVAAPPTRSA
jgi:hypothetical protein